VRACQQKAVAAIREMVGGMHATAQNATAADVPESRSERKRKVLRSAGAVEPAEKKAAPTVAEQEVGERNGDASTAQGRSLTGDATVQPPPVSFNNNHVVTLDTEKGKPVSELGYIGELPSPMAQPAPGDSLASPSAKIEPAAAMQTSTAVVLRVVVGRDGHVEDVQRASGPAELSPASVAAIRQWKFQPNPNGPKHRQIYVTVNFTISPQ
jgi:TonB family protein